jgi:PPIC-type PPIASE domain
VPGVAVALAVALGLAACSGAGSTPGVKRASSIHEQRINAASEEPSTLAGPGAVVARVGSYSITGAMFDPAAQAALRAEPSEHLAPPQFNACVAQLKAEAVALEEQAAGASQLRGECKKRYQIVLQAVLISSEWMIGGARELGASVNEQGVKASSDTALDEKAKLSAAAIRRAIRDRIGPTTRAQVASYYQQHRFEYLLTGERNLRIARTKTDAEAVKVRAEVTSGKSFASVVSKLPVQQPIDSSDGSVMDLSPHFYGEPNLNQAIFTATPGMIVGPINTWFGYFVFEVTKIVSEQVMPLADVEAAIRRHLVAPLEAQELAAFSKRWSTTWTAQTDCSPGYVVPKCRQFKGEPVGAPEAATLG